MQNRHTYIIVFATLAIAVPSFVALVNVAIDPYGFFGTKLVPGFNVLKPEMGDHEKEMKAHAVTALRPDGLILGASTSDVGIDPEHPGWSAEAPYNMAAGRSSISLAHHFLLHVMETRTPKQIVLGLELAGFNPASQSVAGINPASFIVMANGERNREYLALNFYAKAFSLDMLSSAITAFRANQEQVIELDEHRPQINAKGMLNPESFPQNRRKTFRQRFQYMVEKHIDSYWAPRDAFNAIEDFSSDPTFATYQDILRLACDNQIELYIVLSPFHAYLLEAQETVGLTELWERWKTAIVMAVANQAESSDCETLSVWDFSGYNQVTTETIETSRDPANTPKGYWDPIHYRKEVGAEMLNRVFNVGNDNTLTDFGVQLTPANIDSYIEETRKRAVEYRNTHADEVALVNKTVNSTLKTGNK